jgi:hypothetical protein
VSTLSQLLSVRAAARLVIAEELTTLFREPSGVFVESPHDESLQRDREIINGRRASFARHYTFSQRSRANEASPLQVPVHTVAAL